MNNLSLGFISILYVGSLFMVASWAELRSSQRRSLINNPIVYALSLAIYCTGWTYYGSVGRVKTNGLDFLTVYLGPTIALFAGWQVMRKVLHISKLHHITSVADFISARYGKSRSLGLLVSIISMLAGIPYIGLQLKAINASFSLLTGEPSTNNFVILYFVAILIVFTILFGTRKIEASEKHEGMVFSIAFESIIKLVAFLAVGIFTTFYLFNGFESIHTQVSAEIQQQAFSLGEGGVSANWFWHILLSGCVFLLLPRQFQVFVVENNDEKHLQQALWMFPFYMLLMNLFVIPIALGGHLLLNNLPVATDMYVLGIPQQTAHTLLAVLVYIGGFSAATSMIIVETIAISIMMSNNVFLPYVLSTSAAQQRFIQRPAFYVQLFRRLAIAVIIFLGFIYFRFIANFYSLVSIGMVAFVAVAQFAPSFFGGIFWKRATKKGARVGMILGISTWFIWLILPSIIKAAYGPLQMVDMPDGPILPLLDLLRLGDLDMISNATFWSLGINIGGYYFVSIATEQSSIEHNQANLFVNAFQYTNTEDSAVVWRGQAKSAELKELLGSFVGMPKAERLFRMYAVRNRLNMLDTYADAKLVKYTEKVLAGIVGSASARMIVASVAKEEPIAMEEVVAILKRSQALMLSNKELEKTMKELKSLTEQLRNTNDRLVAMDRLKDDFLTTVTHEIRTPLTSIKALSEIIADNHDLSHEERVHFTETIIRESDRLSRLINQVLDLEKYDSGKRKLEAEELDLARLIHNVADSFNAVLREKQILLKISLSEEKLPYRGDTDKLYQVLVNLISNAIKFVPTGSGLIEIAIKHNEEEYLISVKDNGPGIDPAFHELIFEKFYQAENQSIRKPKGTGLGLAISKRIIELHRGTIQVASSKDEGTTFTILLPMKLNEL